MAVCSRERWRPTERAPLYMALAVVLGSTLILGLMLIAGFYLQVRIHGPRGCAGLLAHACPCLGSTRRRGWCGRAICRQRHTRISSSCGSFSCRGKPTHAIRRRRACPSAPAVQPPSPVQTCWRPWYVLVLFFGVCVCMHASQRRPCMDGLCTCATHVGRVPVSRALCGCVGGCALCVSRARIRESALPAPGVGWGHCTVYKGSGIDTTTAQGQCRPTD
jgi:hypothetical protein